MILNCTTIKKNYEYSCRGVSKQTETFYLKLKQDYPKNKKKIPGRK